MQAATLLGDQMEEKEVSGDDDQTSFNQGVATQRLAEYHIEYQRYQRLHTYTRISQVVIVSSTIIYLTIMLVNDTRGPTPGFFSTEFILRAIPVLIVGFALLTIAPMILQSIYSTSIPQTQDSYRGPRDKIDKNNGDNEHEKAIYSGPTINCDRLYILFRERMIQDGKRLAALSLRNLTFGIVFSASSLFFIAFPLFSESQPSDSVEWLTKYYLPRFGVGIILQFVGFFFLRLYVSNEYDIKFNKNEISNFDAKFLSYLVVKESGDKTLLAPVIASLSGTERNFILKKGERVFSQVSDDKYNDVVSMLDTLSESVARLSGRGQSSTGHDRPKALSTEPKKPDSQ